MANLLGADVGTTSLKMTLFNEKGESIASAMREYTLSAKGDIVEFEADGYYDMFLSAYEEIAANHNIDAFSIDTQCETLIVTDDEGKALRPAIVWLDNRATAEAEEIEANFGRKNVYEVTGQAEITATWPAAKLLWLKKNEPEVFSKIKKIFLLSDYLYYRLTGEFMTEPTVESSTIYMDIQNKVWWDEMLEFIGVKPEQLPKIVTPGTYVGDFRGAKAYMGVMDQVAGAIGAGVTKKGTVSEMTGTTMVVFVPTDTMPPFSEESRVPCHANFDGKYSLLLWTPTAGIALKWFKENFAENLSFRELDELAEKAGAGSQGLTFLPYLCGSIMPRYAPSARGAFCGMTMEHGRGHAARAIMESVAFMLYENLEALGIKPEEIRTMGGGAKSKLWCQIKTDIIKTPLVTLCAEETACLGSAILAGVAMGVYKSMEEATETVVKLGKTYTPSGDDYTEALERFFAYSEREINAK